MVLLVPGNTGSTLSPHLVNVSGTGSRITSTEQAQLDIDTFCDFLVSKTITVFKEVTADNEAKYLSKVNCYCIQKCKSCSDQTTTIFRKKGFV
jgi:hypothetical protein